MSNLAEEILGQLGAGGVVQVAGAVGSDNSTTNAALAAVIAGIA